MEFTRSIFSQIRKDHRMPQTSETKDLESNNEDLDTSLKSTKNEVNKENRVTSDTIDNGDKFVPNTNSIYTDTDNENITHDLKTVLSQEDQNIMASEKVRIFTYNVDVEYVNDRVDLPAVTLDESLFIPFDYISNSLKETEPNETQTEVGVIGVDNYYKTYAENIKKVEITDDMTEYTSMTDIVDLDEFKEYFNFDNDSETTFKIKDVEDVIESFTIRNKNFKTQGNHQKEISDVSTKDLEAQSIGDTYNNDLTEKNLNENILSDKESIISISSDDELNDMKLTLSLSDLETISISSLDNVFSEKYAIVTNLGDKQTVTQLESFDDAVNELTDESVKENCNLINSRAIVSLDDSDSCSGYHSSDFEFIKEDEAKETNKFTSETYKTIEISLDIDSSECEKTKEVAFIKKNNSSTSYDYRNAAARYYNNDFRRQNIRDYSYRQNHYIPEGDNYLNLFEGMFEPRVICMMENKMTEPSSIYVQYEGIGFDMRAFNNHHSDAEFEEEAIQSARKILKTYPDDNIKRRRF